MLVAVVTVTTGAVMFPSVSVVSVSYSGYRISVMVPVLLLPHKFVHPTRYH